MIAAQLIKALALPNSTRVDQRVPKTVLGDQVAATAADRRLVKDGIEALHWLASLKPTTIGVPAFADDQREYLEIAVLHLQTRHSATRGAKLARLIELLHRAIPYPVLLIVEGEQTWLSVAHKRWAQNEKDKMVLEDGYPHSTPIPMETPELFYCDLAVGRRPWDDLMVLYQGWLACLLALEAWRETGRYAHPHNIDQLSEQRRRLHEIRELGETIQRLRKQVVKERQIARQVELNLQIKQLEAERTALLNELKKV